MIQHGRQSWQLAAGTACAASLIFLASCIGQPSLPPESEGADPASGRIAVGVVSERAARQIAHHKPLIDYLAANLGGFGIGRGEVRISPDIATMARWLTLGEVDFYWDSYFPATLVSDRSGIKPALLLLKDTAEKYTVFFARGDSGLTSIAELENRMIALQEYESTSSFMVPVGHMIQAGLNPVAKPSPDAALEPGETGYVFTFSDTATIQWVISGKVIAGATDNLYLERLPEATAQELIVLYETEPLIRHQPVLFRPDLDPALPEAVKTLLVELDESAEGRAILEHLGDAGFAEISPEDEARLAQAQVLYDLVMGR